MMKLIFLNYKKNLIYNIKQMATATNNDALFEQVERMQAKIESNSKKIQGLDDKVAGMLSSGAARNEILLVLKKKKILSNQNSKFDDQIISLMQAETTRQTTQAAHLRRQVSKDPVATDHRFIKSKRYLPEGAAAKPQIKDQDAISRKRDSMRAKGKDPGPWTSDMSIGEQEQRSIGQPEDIDVAIVAMGAKKKRSRKLRPRKSKKSRKHRSTSQPRTRISTRRRRR